MITEEKALKNIKTVCEKRLKEIYSARIPDFASEALEWELERLRNSGYIHHFEMHRLVNKAAKRGSFPVVNINTYMIGYLQGYMTLNPLPAHYYCKKCGEYELAGDMLTEFELPDKKCKCGHNMVKYGINIPRETVWGTAENPLKPDMTVRCCEAMLPFAQRELLSEFPKNRLKYMDAQMLTIDINNIQKTKTIKSGFAVIPESMSGSGMDITIEKTEEHDTISNDAAYINSLLKISCPENSALNELYKRQQNTGIYLEDMQVENVKCIDMIKSSKTRKYIPENILFKDLNPCTIGMVASILSLSHDTFTDHKPDPTVRYSLESRSFLKSIYTAYRNSPYPIAHREDAYLHLQNAGIYGGKLMTVYRMFRYGKHIRKPDEFNSLVSEYNLPDELLNSLNLYLYCFPKGMGYSFAQVYLLLAAYYLAEKE